MAATPTQTLLDQSTCFACYGASLTQLLLLSLWDVISQNAGGDQLVLDDGINPPTVIDKPVGSYNFSGGAWVSATATNCHGLTELILSNNPSLTTLTVTGCPNLASLDIAFTVLAALDLTGMSPNMIGPAGITANNNPALASLDASTVISASMIDLSTCPVLVTASFPVLTSVLANVNLTTCNLLVTISAPLMTSVGGAMYCDTCPSLTTLTLTLLQTVGSDFTTQNDTSLTGITMFALTSVGGEVNINGCTALLGFNAQNLVSIGGGFLSAGNTAMTVLDLNSLSTLGNNFVAPDCDSLVSFSSVISEGGINGIFVMNVCNNLTTLGLADWPIPDGQAFDAGGNALTSAAVNGILSAAINNSVALSATTIFLDGGTNGAPSGQGIIDKGLLIAAGNNVNTN